MIFAYSILYVHSIKNFLNTVSDNVFEEDEKLTYAVQIVANYKTKLNMDSIRQKLQINRELKEIFHNNWYKYSVGSFTNIDEARTLKKELRKKRGFGGAFLVCFINDIRQDNLMIRKEIESDEYLAKNENLEYRIQIIASFNKPIPTDSIAKWYSLIEFINENFEDGWYKYSIGSFKNFKAALEARNIYRQKRGLENCFIVAFKEGLRLSHLPGLKKPGRRELSETEDAVSEVSKISADQIENEDNVSTDSLMEFQPKGLAENYNSNAIRKASSDKKIERYQKKNLFL